MEKGEQKRVKAVVEEILAEADMEKVSEKQVREQAAEKAGLDLSTREWRKFVLNVIKKFIESGGDASDAEAATKIPPQEDKHRDGSAKKMRETEEAEENEDVNDQEDQDDEGEVRERKKPKYEMDEEGNTIICELSAKRKVVVSQWKGKTLVSVREYYEKDGKVLPTSKGISLTVDQFEVFAKSVNDIEAAIASLQ